MKLSNKEVGSKLIKYFLKQEPKDIARALAACMVDFNRIAHMHELDKEEMENLQMRVQLNVEELHRFLDNEKQEAFSVIRMDTIYEN